MSAADHLALVKSARHALWFEEWERWELPEYIRAAARSLGIRLSRDDVQRVLNEV
jgi:hypothetical protein